MGTRAWLPTDATSAPLVLWIDPSDASTLTLDVYSRVTQARDKSAQGNHFAPPSGVTGVTLNTFGSTGLYAFVGNQSYSAGKLVSSGSGLNNLTNGDCTLASIWVPNSYGGSSVEQVAFAFFANASANAPYALVSSCSADTSGNDAFFPTDRFNGSALGGNRNYTNPAIDVMVRSSTAITGSVNGVALTGQSGGANFTTATGGVHISSAYQSYGNYLPSSRTGDCIAYGAALSTSDRQKLEGYLAWKWGFRGYLPSSHPYFNAAPTVTLPVDVTASGTVPTSTANTPTATATGTSSATGALRTSTNTAPTASPTASASASGAFVTAIISAALATAYGSASPQGSLTASTTAPISGTAIGTAAASGTFPTSASAPIAGSAQAGATASGALATSASTPATAVGKADSSPAAALPLVTASPIAGSATVTSSIIAPGALASSTATPPAATIAAGANVSAPMPAVGAYAVQGTGGASTIASGALPTASATAVTGLGWGSGGAFGAMPVANVTPLRGAASASVLASGALPTSTAVTASATVSATSPIPIIFIAAEWARSASRRVFSAVAARRSFHAVSKGKRSMVTFPNKYASEVREASIDLAPLLAVGETLTGIPTVELVTGDVVVAGGHLVGSRVLFSVAGGTSLAGQAHVIAVRCWTSQGQLVGDDATLRVWA